MAAHLPHVVHVALCADVSRCVRIVSDVDALLADEPRAAVECHSLLASCFFAVARQGRAGRVRRRRPGVDVIRSSPGDEDAQRMVQDGVCWKIGDVIKHRKHGYTGNESQQNLPVVSVLPWAVILTLASIIQV
eukprot:COSAG02_NODE_1643_length_11528_cov_19.259865_8_plen_133_part_00